MMRLFAILAATGASALSAEHTARAEQHIASMSMTDALAQVNDMHVSKVMTGKLDPEAVKKAMKRLNEMLLAANNEMDEIDIRCQGEFIRMETLIEQMSGDLNRYGQEMVAANKDRQEAVTNGELAENAGNVVKEDLDKEVRAYESEKANQEEILRVQRADLEVAELILSAARCEDGKITHTTANYVDPDAEKALLQGKSHLEICAPMSKEDRSLVRFASPVFQARLEDLMSKTSGDTHRRLQDLFSKHAEGPVSFLQLEQTPAGLPKAQPQRGCSMSKVNCGLLHDDMSSIWGELRDAVDETLALMHANEMEFNEIDTAMKSQIEGFSIAAAAASRDLADATKTINEIDEQQKAKTEEKEAADKEYNEIKLSCQSEIDEILYSRSCGLRKVRTALKTKATEENMNIVDCEVSGWQFGECDAPCGTGPEGLDGGNRQLTRSVTVPPDEEGFGMRCPTMEYTQKCNQHLCPVDCAVSAWSAYSKCSKDCEGGVKTRSRSVVEEPSNGGSGCPPVAESVGCNTGSCDRNCSLHKWSKFWTPCTRACGGGTKEKSRDIRIPIRGEGKCPTLGSDERTKVEKCNTKKCMTDEQCIAKMDLVLAVDGSGSVGSDNWKIATNFTGELYRRMGGVFRSRQRTRIGLIKFGNGEIFPDGTVRAPKLVQKLECYKGDDGKCVVAREDTDSFEAPETWFKSWEEGPAKDKALTDFMTDGSGITNMAQVFSMAQQMFEEVIPGRKKAVRSLIIISDAKPSNMVDTLAKAQDLKDTGVVINMINVRPDSAMPEPGEEDPVREIASKPQSDHIYTVKQWRDLSGGNTEQAVSDAITMFCSKASSPYRRCMSVKKHKAMKWKANHDCPIWWDYLGFYWSGKECAASARGKGYSYYVMSNAWWWKGICFGHVDESKTGECGYTRWWGWGSGSKGFVRSGWDVWKVEEEAPNCKKPTLGGAVALTQLPDATWSKEKLAQQFDLEGHPADSRNERNPADLAKHGLAFLNVDPSKRRHMDKQSDAEPEAWKHYKDEDWEEGDENVSPEMAAEEAELDRW